MGSWGQFQSPDVKLEIPQECETCRCSKNDRHQQRSRKQYLSASTNFVVDILLFIMKVDLCRIACCLNLAFFASRSPFCVFCLIQPLGGQHTQHLCRPNPLRKACYPESERSEVRTVLGCQSVERPEDNSAFHSLHRQQS